LNGLGLVNNEQLKTLGLSMPKLAGPFSENLKALEKETKDIGKMAALIESNPEIAKSVYPVALVFGSRLKGYGSENSDIDIGVFVRPDVSPDDKDKLQALLQKTFQHEKVRGEIVQFRLEKNKEALAVQDRENPAPWLGDSSWTHVLFGAAWTGKAEAINELREKLLVPYFYDEEKTVHGRDARGLYLEELERDTLQYRLMHKGYAKFFPPIGGIDTPHADNIDGQSMFWDSGYRRIATKLFASRVFLPKLKP
jgi:predicted nucleotidyltransferase